MRTNYPEKIEKDFEDELVILMDEQIDIFQDVWKEVLGEKIQEGTRKNSEDEENIRDLIELIKTEAAVLISTEDVKALAESIGKQIKNYSVHHLNESANGVAGVNMFKSNYVDGRKLRKHITECVNKIKSMPDYYFDNLEKVILEGMDRGDSLSTIGRAIDEVGEKSSKYARLIARDQTGNIAGFVEEVQLTGMGLTRGIWRTMKDGVVRDRHEEREGEEFDIKEGIDGEKPKQAHLCRCETEIKNDDILRIAGLA